MSIYDLVMPFSFKEGGNIQRYEASYAVRKSGAKWQSSDNNVFEGRFKIKVDIISGEVDGIGTSRKDFNVKDFGLPWITCLKDSPEYPNKISFLVNGRNSIVEIGGNAVLHIYKNKNATGDFHFSYKSQKDTSRIKAFTVILKVESEHLESLSNTMLNRSIGSVPGERNILPYLENYYLDDLYISLTNNNNEMGIWQFNISTTVHSIKSDPLRSDFNIEYLDLNLYWSNYTIQQSFLNFSNIVVNKDLKFNRGLVNFNDNKDIFVMEVESEV